MGRMTFWCPTRRPWSIIGWFRNGLLGSYRAYVTDPELTVVIDLGDRTFVVSPDRPHLFADEVRRAAAAAKSEPAESAS